MQKRIPACGIAAQEDCFYYVSCKTNHNKHFLWDLESVESIPQMAAVWSLGLAELLKVYSEDYNVNNQLELADVFRFPRI